MNLEGRGEGGRIFAGQAFCPCVWGAWVGPWGYSCGCVYLSQAVLSSEVGGGINAVMGVWPHLHRPARLSSETPALRPRLPLPLPYFLYGACHLLS